MKRIIAIILLAAAILMLLSGCNSSGPNTLSAVWTAKVLKVAVLSDAPPYSQYDAASDSYAGSDIQFVEFLASKLEAAVEYVACEDKSELLAAVTGGTAHMALGRLLDTECQTDKVSISASVQNGYVYVVTPRGKYMSTLGAFEGKTIGASAALSDTVSIQLHGIPSVLVQPYPDITNIEQNLLNKTIEAYVCYENQALALTRSEALQAEVLSNATIERYVIAFPKGDTTMSEYLNETITEYAGAPGSTEKPVE